MEIDTWTNIDESKLKALVEKRGSKLKWAQRIDFRTMEQSLVEEVVYKKGLPLVISNTTLSWRRDRDMFGWDWLRRNAGGVTTNPYDCNTNQLLPEWHLAEFINYLQQQHDEQSDNNSFSGRSSSSSSSSGRTLFARDVPCPSAWRDFMGSRLTPFWTKANFDLLGELLPQLQSETLGIQLGHGGVSAPARIQTSGTLVHNVMVFSDEGSYALWACVSADDSEKALQFFEQSASSSGETRDIFHDSILLSLERLSEAPFTVHLIEQREGDFVLLPSTSIHQVVHKGGRNIQVEWNVLQPQMIDHAYFHGLPLMRSRGIPERFRLKAAAYYSLLNRVQIVTTSKIMPDHLADEFPALLSVVEDIIYSEWIDTQCTSLPVPLDRMMQKKKAKAKPKKGSRSKKRVVEDEPAEIPEEEIDVLRFTDDDVPHQRICDFCKCDIFNRCYHCAKCPSSFRPGRGYDICQSCVAEGRGCEHAKSPNPSVSLQLMEYISLSTMVEHFEKAKEAYQKVLRSAKRKKNRKRKVEEWQSSGNLDIEEAEEEGEYTVTVEKGQSPATLAFFVLRLYSKPNEDLMCHQCQKAQPYSQAVLICCQRNSCDKMYCARCLWNRYGKKMVDCLQTEDWKCPSCSKNCNCTACEGVVSNPTNLPENLLEMNYPFQAVSGASVPAVSDIKPVFQTFVLKKRKMFGGGMGNFGGSSNSGVDTSSSPTSTTMISPSPSQQDLTTTSVSTPTKEVVMREFVEPPVTTPVKSKSVETPTKPPPAPQPDDWWTVPNDEEVKPESSSNGSAPADDMMHYSSNNNHHSGHHHNNNNNYKEPSNEFLDHYSTILVRNLPYMCTSEEIDVFFKACGPLDNIAIPTDKVTGKMKGYAFVKFKNRAGAEYAMDKLNFTTMRDRQVELEWSVDKATQLKRGGICFKCGKEGHFARSCTDPDRSWQLQDRKEGSSWNRGDSSSSTSTSTTINTDGDNGDMGNNGDRKRDVHKGYVCFKCGKVGHVATDCRERVGDMGPGFKGVICFKCGQGGHLANKCEKKTRGCYICGQEGHIAVECSERHNRNNNNANGNHDAIGDNNNRDQQQGFRSPTSNNNNNLSEPSLKYRKVVSPTNTRESSSSSSWDNNDYRERDSTSRDRDRDRQEPRYNQRERKSGWDEPPRPSSANSSSSLRDSSDRNSSSNSYYRRNDDYSRDNRDRDRDRDRDNRYDSRDSRSSDRDYRNASSSSSYSDNNNNSNSNGTISYSVTSYGSSNNSLSTPPNSQQQQQQSSFGYSSNPSSSYNLFSPNNGPNSNVSPIYLNSSSNPQTPTGFQSINGQPVFPFNNPAQLANFVQSAAAALSQQQQQAPLQQDERHLKTVDEKEKKQFKVNASNVVVAKLSKFYSTGQIATKDEFKQLSRKIVNTLLERQAGRYSMSNKDLETAVKKLVEHGYQQYSYYAQRNQLGHWLQSDSPIH